MKAIAMIAVLIVFTFLPGCGAVSKIWVAENNQYESAVVEGVLLPHYLADPAISPASKSNVQNAVDEHKARLLNWGGQ